MTAVTTIITHVADVARSKGITSAAALAAATGLTEASAAHWWTGQTWSFDIDELGQICEALDASVGELIGLGQVEVEGE